jgi:CHASE2 domain-containing sensor protein
MKQLCGSKIIYPKIKTMFKYLFKRDTLFATIAVFFVMGLFSFLPINTHFLDPIHLALSDFDYNDLAYSKMHKNEDKPTDTNIVIVNIDYADRILISMMLDKINEQNPKAIGIDLLFNEHKDMVGDTLLARHLASNPKIVSVFNYTSAYGHDTKLHKNPRQQLGVFPSKHKGYANFVGEEGGVVRHFSPFLKEEKLESFSAAVVKIADPKRFQELSKRNNLTEIINYSRKPEKYIVINGLDLANEKIDGKVLRNKIVLLGYVSSNANDVEDKHFTPLNAKYTGRALPDMNGIFIHANIISMIQSQDYIRHLPSWLMWSIAFLLCWLHMALFIKDYLDNHIWFHLLAKIAQIISAVFFVYIGLLCFHSFDTKINMTATLAAIILAVDVLYFYEALATWMHKKYKFSTIFTHKHD